MRIILEDIQGKRRGPFETGDYEPTYLTYRGQVFARQPALSMVEGNELYRQTAMFELDDDMLIKEPPPASPAREEQAAFL